MGKERLDKLLEEAIMEGYITCRECGSLLEPDAEECGECGWSNSVFTSGCI